MRTKSKLILYPQFAQGWYRIINSWTGSGYDRSKVHYYNKSFTSICGVSGEVDRGLCELSFLTEKRKCKLCINYLNMYLDINNLVHTQHGF